MIEPILRNTIQHQELALPDTERCLAASGYLRQKHSSLSQARLKLEMKSPEDHTQHESDLSRNQQSFNNQPRRDSLTPQVMSVVDRPNVLERSATVNETVKKSNASHVFNRKLVLAQRRNLVTRTQAMKATAKKAHCWPVIFASRRKGLGAFSMGGLRLVKRVARY